MTHTRTQPFIVKDGPTINPALEGATLPKSLNKVGRFCFLELELDA